MLLRQEDEVKFKTAGLSAEQISYRAKAVKAEQCWLQKSLINTDEFGVISDGCEELVTYKLANYVWDKLSKNPVLRKSADNHLRGIIDLVKADSSLPSHEHSKAKKAAYGVLIKAFNELIMKTYEPSTWTTTLRASLEPSGGFISH